MKVHAVTQGTPEWKRLRAGIPTASAFDQLVVSSLNKDGQLASSKSLTKYLHKLLTERLLG